VAGRGSELGRPAEAGGPRFAASGPDAEDYGASQGYPMGDRATFYTIPFLVGSHSHLDQVLEGRTVRRAATSSALRRVASEPAVTYEFEGQRRTIDDYLSRHPATGLLIARDDTILVERYQYARNDRHRFTSWSMAKTVTAMLVGIAIADGSRTAVSSPSTIAPRCTCPRCAERSTAARPSDTCCRCPPACGSSRSTPAATT
jgi:CubicO group peptidase (beta-lactamase class C family)